MSAGTDFLASLQKKTVKSTVQQKQQKRANASAVDVSALLEAALRQKKPTEAVADVRQSADVATASFLPPTDTHQGKSTQQKPKSASDKAVPQKQSTSKSKDIVDAGITALIQKALDAKKVMEQPDIAERLQSSMESEFTQLFAAENEPQESKFVSTATFHTTKKKIGSIRVAAYIRVSTDMSDQENSYETQEKYFNQLIQSNPEWNAVGVYSDYGISGTSKEKRTGFRRLMRHCKDGKIDRIVCKSISRFARNTADFMTALDTLHDCGVTILFEKENLDTADPTSDFILTTLAAIAQEESRSISGNIRQGNKMRFPKGEVPNKIMYGYRYNGKMVTSESGYEYKDIEVVEEEAKVVRRIFNEVVEGKGELILTILSALAQDESRSISDNIRWSIQKKFQAGVPHINLKRMLGYELGPNKQWVIVPEQAEIIRYIFDRYVKGQTANKIARELNQMEKLTVNGKKWRASSILIVLRNEKYVGDIEMQKTITKDFLTHRSSINKGEAPRYYVKNHHVGIIDRVTWDKVQTMLFEKPRTDMTKGPGKKKVKSIKGSPFGNLRCGAILENGPDAGKPCGEGFFRVTYTGVANGYTDERSLQATGEDTGEYLEKYTYSYPVWRCKRKVGERDGEPPKNGTPDQKAYCRSKLGRLSDEERKAADERCPSEVYHECALEQSFMELLYSMKRDYEQHGDASMIVTMFDNAYEQAVQLANNSSISVQRMATVENQIKEMEERLQDAISHQVAALREAALEQSAELNEALSNGEVTIDDIDMDIRSGLTPGSIGVSFYGTETEEGSEAQIYTELVNDLQERLQTLRQERQTIEEEQGVLAIMKKNFEYFLACLKELPDANASGMPLKVNGLDVQGSLMRDAEGKPIEGKTAAVHNGKIRLTPERIAEAPDMLHFEKGIYCAFIESGVLQGDVATYKTNFGVTLTSKGNRRTLTSFMGYKRSDLNGNVVYIDAPYKVYGFSIQYRRYLTTAAKRERKEAV